LLPFTIGQNGLSIATPANCAGSRTTGSLPCGSAAGGGDALGVGEPVEAADADGDAGTGDALGVGVGA
jgi:hypothetical protein